MDFREGQAHFQSLIAVVSAYPITRVLADLGGLWLLPKWIRGLTLWFFVGYLRIGAAEPHQMKFSWVIRKQLHERRYIQGGGI